MTFATVAEFDVNQFTVSTSYLAIDSDALELGMPVLLSTAVFDALGRPIALLRHASWSDARDVHGFIVIGLQELMEEGRAGAEEVIRSISKDRGLSDRPAK
ncbi:hypothetical protein ACODYM_29120 [Burkholderia gladioli]|uniref:hypothetical protein n=1 Tax=Burkholderia gladioli TaxID=28095 RepID=UPI003B50EB62